MGRLSDTRAWSVFGLALLALPFLSEAAVCSPDLHSDIAIEADNVIIESNNNRFRIEPAGTLFVNVHRIDLNDEQKASLSAYSKAVRNDLPYIGRTLSQELQTSWLALDGVIADELGDTSSLRSELGQYHQYLQTRVNASLFNAEREAPQLNHTLLKQTVREVEASVPQIVATVSSRGLMDIAVLSEGQTNKMQFMSEKMAVLQDRLVGEAKLQRDRTKTLQKDLCQRLNAWQQHEEAISHLIPALSGLKTVTIR
ncbi:DUF2884 family protein [Enterovibrio nigricans]|uniref:DUF2884 family protein n=1 Tax=Enterovibrio nigricans DSM 22720 TaxID=1121868 RepID=A0A1T4TYI3_9GAMM|nr:DUF2884 family protein [Enterovibrio nigricans]PKF50072.1 DUF2884 domain-containing protein [Enterovibrio nigricans]SKA45537.1 Protein of unknown function [Enterovibrio nigricans DSM 22720]